MLNLKSKLTWLSLAGLLAAPAAFANGGWAVIVWNPLTNSAGSFHGAPDRAEAENAALNLCGSGCAGVNSAYLESGQSPVRETFILNGWIALASDNMGHFGSSGIHDSQQNAERAAIANCGNSNCFIVRSMSSYQNYPDVDGTNNMGLLRPIGQPQPQPQPYPQPQPQPQPGSGFYVGEQVVETYDSLRSTLTITAIIQNGDLVLSNGQEYSQNYVQPLLQTYNGISVGQQVVETYDSLRSILTVNEISGDGDYELSNGNWYSSNYIQPLLSSANGIQVGQQVVEVYDSLRSTLTVNEISGDGDFLLSNGNWYSRNYIVTLLNSYNGISLNQSVVEIYDSLRSTLTVNEITSDGDYLLSNGNWYSSNYVVTLLNTYNGIYVGQQVMETYDSLHQILTVSEISSDGDFLLSNGNWYSSNYIQAINTGYGYYGGYPY